MRAVVFFGGISAIIFIIAIFVFITVEGVGFIADRWSFSEFFASMFWRPTSDSNPTYGAMALMLGTASVTGFAMLVAVPFSLGAAVFIGEFATGKHEKPLCSRELAAIPSVVWGFIGLSLMNPFIIDAFGVPVGQCSQ